jgi:hypothetical protein
MESERGPGKRSLPAGAAFAMTIPHRSNVAAGARKSTGSQFTRHATKPSKIRDVDFIAAFPTAID